MIMLAMALALASDPPCKNGAATCKPWEREWGSSVVTTFGGDRSCANSFRPEILPYTREWVAGFYSGRNVGQGRRIGERTDMDGIMGEVAKVCDQHPSWQLVRATNEAFNTMTRES